MMIPSRLLTMACVCSSARNSLVESAAEGSAAMLIVQAYYDVTGLRRIFKARLERRVLTPSVQFQTDAHHVRVSLVLGHVETEFAAHLWHNGVPQNLSFDSVDRSIAWYSAGLLTVRGFFLLTFLKVRPGVPMHSGQTFLFSAGERRCRSPIKHQPLRWGRRVKVRPDRCPKMQACSPRSWFCCWSWHCPRPKHCRSPVTGCLRYWLLP